MKGREYTKARISIHTGQETAGSKGKYPGRLKRDKLKGIYIPKLKVSIKNT